jgi:hypothetical protein
MYCRPTLFEEELQPWTNEDTQINTLVLEPHPPHPRRPPQTHKLPARSPPTAVAKAYNFFDNLRCYERKKAHELNLQRETNFIERNRRGLNDENTVSVKPASLGGGATMEPLQWSMLMYYDSGSCGPKMHQSVGVGPTLRLTPRPQRRPPPVAKREVDNFQKVLKLREGLRKRNLKSASTSRRAVCP